MTFQPRIDGAVNAWLIVESHRQTDKRRFSEHVLELDGARFLQAALGEDDWVLLVSPSGVVTDVARILRIRSDLETTTLYFDRLAGIDNGSTLATLGLTLPKNKRDGHACNGRISPLR